MVRYYTSVNKRSKKEMISFLVNHFRYSTMNNWNRMTSYACNVKIHNLGLDSDISNKLYEMIYVNDFQERMEIMRQSFMDEHDYQWMVGMNGRSGGYLVLYSCSLEPSGYKSYCELCGQHNYKHAAEIGHKCGRCGSISMVDFKKTNRIIRQSFGSGDMDEDYEGWTMDELRDRVELVQSLDRLADVIVAEAVNIAKNYDVQDDVVLTRQTCRVIVPCK